MQLGGLAPQPTDDGAVAFASELIELRATLDDGNIGSLMLLLRDPDAAAATRDDCFRVTVVSRDGQNVPANLATGATLTFLREALGCPLTRASQLYAALLNTREPVRWAGSLISLEALGDGAEARHGVLVRPG